MKLLNQLPLPQRVGVAAAFHREFFARRNRAHHEHAAGHGKIAIDSTPNAHSGNWFLKMKANDAEMQEARNVAEKINTLRFSVTFVFLR